ncbi:ABC-type transport, permease protein [Thermovirga lienii DSM 17291]|uniref:ABC-type transport, permease protein n=1 Tax=Thermovirga lienii (strain ATCC BAA-1197 / DSM 17291 / Cas60314) TaxID=580340 RepID=G7V7L4_THELD|nr:ABC transporter permease subunit [Thermovirga lienii]AER66176.1 ABC-type transport, permease protein [Thermovirga lienii DSM 17291]
MTGIRTIFWKEMADHFGSKRFLVIAFIIVLASLSSAYGALGSPELHNFGKEYLFLSLLSTSGGTLPSFLFFVSFLTPLIGIIMGFDAINGEKQRGTLSMLVSQPIYRDSIINGKFLAALAVSALMIAGILALIAGVSMSKLGIVPNEEEIARTLVFYFATLLYISFWLSMAILFSVLFDKTSTSALASIALWIFLVFFVYMVAGILADHLAPISQNSSVEELMRNERLKITFMRASPAYLLQEISMAVLNPAVRILTPLTADRLQGLIPTPLSVGQSVMVVWPQLVVLCALSIICFGISYVAFMRKEIRS